MNILKLTCSGIFISLILYGRLLPYAFTQDDFFLLRQARFNSFSQQLIASLPRPDGIYFRPIGMQVYFFLAWRLFGLHPWAYRLVAIVVHVFNATLVYLIAKKILIKNSWIVWLMYLTAPLHFAAIGWIANISFITGTFFSLLAILAVLSNRPMWNTIVLYILGILTNELAITAPFLILLFSKKRKQAMSLFITASVYVVFRLFMPRAAVGPYQADIGIHLLQNIRWLLLWTLGWTEAIKDYFINLWQIKDEFTKTFPFETAVQIATSLLLLLLLAFGMREKKVWIGILFFIVALLPVLPFREHIYPHYAMIGGIGLFSAVVIGLNKLPKYLLYGVLTLWLVQVAAAMRINVITHWWVQHALLSETLQYKLKTRYPVLPLSKQVDVVYSQPDQARIVLAEDNAVKLLYNDPTATVRYVMP